MRIAYVCADAGIPIYGSKGASIHVQGVLRAMRRAGHDVVVLAARTGDVPPAWATDLGVTMLPRLAGDAPDPAAVTAHNQAMAAALAQLGPVDLVYERLSLWSFGAMEHARQVGIPGCLEVNAPLVDEAVTHRGLADRTTADRAVARALAAASQVIAVSEEVAAWAKANPCTTGPVVVEPNGVDPARFTAQRPAVGAAFTLGFIGTLKPWHGLDQLADTFALVKRRVPDARLLIVGDGPGRESLTARLVRREVSDAVTFTGAVPAEQVGAQLARMHVALAPYPARGPFYFSPLKVVECQAAGVPVVASEVGQLRSLIRHRETGWLVPPGSARAMALACLAIHAAPAQAATMANVARAEVLAERSWDAVVDRILARASARGGRGPVTRGPQQLVAI
ncbi:MAG: glycosyltransferase family 4 protein [Gemmatimonadetes bacterium]|nr:glycosyltransferase family 4 protein [Gemmatimonadota bacterium]